MVSTRTSSPYFSPNSAIAPASAIAWSVGISRVETSEFWRMTVVRLVLDAASLVRRQRLGMGEVEAQPVGLTSEPFCATWVPKRLAARHAADAWRNDVARVRGGARDRLADPPHRRAQTCRESTCAHVTCRSPSFFSVSVTVHLAALAE